jgi:hypothetical protein
LDDVRSQHKIEAIVYAINISGALPCRLIFGYFISDNGNDTRVKTSVSLIPFLEGAKKGINFVSMIQNLYHQVTIADTVF